MSSMIQPVSGPVSGAAQLSAAAGVRQTPHVQPPEEEARRRPVRPSMDEYVPEEGREPSGLYWLGRDEDGQPKLYFDDPEQPDEPAHAPGPGKRAAGDRAERCTGSTDQVDREIERLKKKKESLEQQINAQTDETRIKELERKLAQVERELSQKDNDAYRRQHTVFS